MGQLSLSWGDCQGLWRLFARGFPYHPRLCFLNPLIKGEFCDSVHIYTITKVYVVTNEVEVTCAFVQHDVTHVGNALVNGLERGFHGRLSSG
jgi:hypothetical protein